MKQLCRHLCHEACIYASYSIGGPTRLGHNEYVLPQACTSGSRDSKAARTLNRKGGDFPGTFLPGLCNSPLRPSFVLFLIPLVRREAPWRPGVYGCNLCFQRRIDQSVSRQCVLLFKLLRNDGGIEGLAAATYD